MTLDETTLSVAGLPVHYLEGGSQNGRALVLLHGGIGDAAANWREVLAPLAQDYHVIAPDLPGFGGSAALPEMTFDACVEWLQALLDALNVREAVIVGSFIGALIARLFAAAKPQYVPGLILVNGGMMPSLPPLIQQIVHLPVIGSATFGLIGWWMRSRRALDRMIYNKAVLTDDFRQAWQAGAPAFVDLVRVLFFSPRPAARIPPVPTLLLWGANDPTMTPSDAEQLKQIIPGAKLTQIADCGSLPQLEASDAFVFQVTMFLEQLTRPTLPPKRGVGMLREARTSLN